MAYHEIEKESFLHKDGEERVFFVDKDARDRLDEAEQRLDDLEAGGGGGGGGAVTSVNGKTGAVTLNASDVGALPDSTVIPAAVTEQDVAGWGFTKNTGTYSKPSGGIPKTDLASAVQTSLGKADTALQSHQSLAGYATEQWVENKGYLTQHQDISGKADKITVTASDNGKFMRVVNGTWAAVEVPSAESNSFGGGST